MGVYVGTPTAISSVPSPGTDAAWDTTGPPYVCLSHLAMGDNTDYFRIKYDFSIPTSEKIVKAVTTFGMEATIIDSEPVTIQDLTIQFYNNSGLLGNNAANGQQANSAGYTQWTYDVLAGYALTPAQANVHGSFGMVIEVQQVAIGSGRAQIQVLAPLTIYTYLDSGPQVYIPGYSFGGSSNYG